MKTRKEVLEKKRPSRTTNSRKNVLTVIGLTDTDEFHYHWFNDIGENIPKRLEEGYEFVDRYGKIVGDKTVETARGSDSLLKKPVGFGIYAYLMKIPMDVYREYKETERRENVTAFEAEIKRSVKTPGNYGSIDVSR